MIFVGTDVSGELHLGHVSLLAIAEMLATQFQSKLIVSLNEIESICSRDNNLNDLFKNRAKITAVLENHNTAVHSRADDINLTLFALRIWRQIINDKNKTVEVNKFYNSNLTPADILSVIVMAVSPIFVCKQYNQSSILMVYGMDEREHLEYIYNLYQTSWFKTEAKQILNTKLPKLNYLLIRLLPDRTNNFKMSKTRPNTTIYLSQISSRTKLTPPIYDYLSKLVPIIANTPKASQNSWLAEDC